MTDNIASLQRPEQRVRSRKRVEALSVLQPSLMRLYEEIRSGQQGQIVPALGGRDSNEYRTAIGDVAVYFYWLGSELHGKIIEQGKTLLLTIVLQPVIDVRTWKRGDWESAIVKAAKRRMH